MKLDHELVGFKGSKAVERCRLGAEEFRASFDMVLDPEKFRKEFGQQAQPTPTPTTEEDLPKQEEEVKTAAEVARTEDDLVLKLQEKRRELLRKKYEQGA
mmetsp:Transcript_6528/g.10496  ORF Transcript_6528/g.10496 Transcript_6528/m.10496 type:complete len:100 (-) Transcript_6528:20-319(-)